MTPLLCQCAGCLLPADVSGHVAVHSAQPHQQEVEALDPEELLDVDRTNPDVAIEGIDFQEAVVTRVIHHVRSK